MKNILLTFLLIAILSSCNKEDLKNENLRLTEVNQQNTGGQLIVVKTNFSYDDYGRLKTIVYGINNVSSIVSSITYQPGKIIINPLVEPLYNETNQLIYTVGSSNSPLSRSSLHETHIPTATGLQDTYELEITNYQYSGTGFINGFSGVRDDSVIYYSAPGVQEKQVKKIIFTANFTIVDENVATITRVSNETIKVDGVVSNFSNVTTETTVFFYDKRYPNKFDFINILLLNESGILPYSGLFKDPKFRNLPNKAVTTKVVKDLSGNIQSSSSLTEEPSFTFSENGFINKKKIAGSPDFEETFIYKSL